MKWEGSQQDWIKGCDKLIKFLQKESDRAESKNEEDKQKKLKKLKERREEYQTEEDVQMAYGYGHITQNQREMLLKELEIGEADILALNDIDAYVSLIASIIRDLEQEKCCLLPDEVKSKDYQLSDVLTKAINSRK